MKSSPRKRLSAEQRRSKIMSAGVRIFARKGFDGASMTAIATAAGVTKPVLYDHFASKDALFETLLHSIRDRLLAQGQQIGQLPVDPEIRFRLAVTAFFEFVETQPDAARILLIIPVGNSATAKLSREVQQGATAGISNLLKTFLPKSEHWQYEATGEFLKEGMHALAKWWLAHPDANRKNIVDTVVTLCWVGLKEAKKSRDGNA